MKFLKYFSYLVLLISIPVLSIHFNVFEIKDKIYQKYPNLNLRKYLFKKEPVFNRINNDYNVKFLPNTELIKMNLEKKKIKFNSDYYTSNAKKKNIAYNKYGSFFIETFDKNILITDYRGNIYLSLVDELFSNDKKMEPKFLSHNLSEIDRDYDSMVFEKNLYLTYVKKTKECKKIVISFANLNKKEFDFKNFFVSECSEVAPGRMAVFSVDGVKGILLSVSSGSYNEPSLDAQNDNSINGKVIFIGFDEKKHSVFTKGHRVVQGLYVDNNLVIATEHGPRGGDEINILKSKHNYGWPISSYGEKYDFNYEQKPFFKKTHFSQGFEEPIFTFVPAIGISEIIKLPNEFSEMFNNVYVVSSLYGKSIFLVRLNKKPLRITFAEKIFLNERIRDIKYLKEKQTILLAFETKGEIGILKKTN